MKINKRENIQTELPWRITKHFTLNKQLRYILLPGRRGVGEVVGGRKALGLLLLLPPPTTELSSVSLSAFLFLIFSLNLSLLLFNNWMLAQVSSPILTVYNALLFQDYGCGSLYRNNFTLHTCKQNTLDSLILSCLRFSFFYTSM